MIQRFKSPNFDERPHNTSINCIVIHSTHISFIDSLRRLCDPNFKVSCHYLIDRNGDTYQLVKDQYRAWHAGKSYWRGKENLNDTSIGIELVDTSAQNVRLKHFSGKQMRVLIGLLRRLISKYKIPSANIVAHSDIAPDRKDDPGENFNWKKLFSLGIGVYHSVKFTKSMRKGFIKANSQASEIKKLQKLLKKYGYKIKITGKFDKCTKEVMIAFKRHFNPLGLRNSFCSVGDYEILKELSTQESFK